MEYKDPGRYIPIIYLLYSLGSRFGVPSRVPLSKGRSLDKYQYVVALDSWYSSGACTKKRPQHVKGNYSGHSLKTPA